MTVQWYDVQVGGNFVADKKYHIKFGIASGIPQCCIKFFVGAWKYHYDNLTLYYRMTRVGQSQYVQCPKCHKEKREVKLIIGTYEELCGGSDESSSL